MTQRKLWRLLCLCSCLAVGTAGCAPYVNIPPQAGDVALHNANLATVQDVTIAAVRALLDQQPIVGPYTLVLPRGTSPASYQRVTAALGENATTEVNAERPIVEVRQLRIRADKAEVDIVTPADRYEPRGQGRLTTVYTTWKPFTGWEVNRLHSWTALVEIEEPAPDYATAPVVEPTATPEPETADQAAEEPAAEQQSADEQSTE